MLRVVGPGAHGKRSAPYPLTLIHHHHHHVTRGWPTEPFSDYVLVRLLAKGKKHGVLEPCGKEPGWIISCSLPSLLPSFASYFSLGWRVRLAADGALLPCGVSISYQYQVWAPGKTSGRLNVAFSRVFGG